MLNGIFFVSNVGEAILRKDFLPTESHWSPETFVLQLKRNNYVLPVCHLCKHIYYFHILCDKVYIVAVTDLAVASAYIVVAYLERISLLLRDLLGIVTAESVRANIALAYELVCESTNSGFPKLIEVKKMKTLLCNSAAIPRSKATDFLSALPENLFGAIGDANKRVLPSEATKKPVLGKGCKQTKNEVFVDLIENLSVVVDSTGLVLLYNVEGKLEAKSYLNMPAKVSIVFSQCSSLQQDAIFENACYPKSVARTSNPTSLSATLVPGSLCVMRYSAEVRSESCSLPFTLYTNVVPVKNDKMLMVNLKIHSSLPVRNPANNFCATLPLPHATLTASGTSSLANIEFVYDKHEQRMILTSPLFPGESNHRVSIKVFIAKWSPVMRHELGSVTVQFEAPMFSQSKLHISNFKVHTSDSAATGPDSQPIQRWVRYLSYSKSYEFYLKDDWLDDTQ